MPPCPAPDTCLCYLFRHGATANNVARPPRLQGRRFDPPLSAEGREQARRTAELLAHEPIAAVYSSPLLRARQTAEAIAPLHGEAVGKRGLAPSPPEETPGAGSQARCLSPFPHGGGLKVQVVEDLIEIDVGQWEGMAWEEIERAHPEAARLFLEDASIHPYLGGENLSQVQARATPAIERLLSENLGRAIVVVAHNIVNRAYLAHVLQMPLSHYRTLTQDNCALNVLSYRQGQTKVLTLNAMGHLGRE